MKRLTIPICMLILSVSFLQLQAQTDAEMKAWMDYMTPGDVHKMMAKWDGEWVGEVSMWMAPNTAPTKSTMTTTNKMILGGRYQESRNTGSFNGMPFEGVGTTGYDNAKKTIVSTWIDNMGTGIMTMEGQWDAATKTLNMKGRSVDPMTGKEMDMREVFKIVDDNTQVMEMYVMPAGGGAEYKTMEIKFTRKK